MKTTIKPAALALIPLLALLSCSPEVSLTSRNFNGTNSSDNKPALTDYTVDDLLPTLTGTLNYSSGATDSQKELTFTFPVGADFLKKSNSAIEEEMIKFLTLFRFNLAATDGNIMPGTVTDTVDYKFVRRETTSNAETTNIIIRVPTAPSSTMMAKIDGTVYTVYGQKLDVNGDGIAGEAIYDDVYYTTTVIPTPSNTGTWVPEGGQLSSTDNGGTYSNWTLTINGTPGFLATRADNYTIATLTGPVPYPGSDQIQAEVLPVLAPLFKIQEYSQAGNAWTNTSATIDYDKDTGDILVRNFQANHLSLYRVYASGVSNLVTENEYYGAPQKIAVSISAANLLGDMNDYNGFYRDVIVTEMGSLVTNDNTTYNPQPQGSKSDQGTDYVNSVKINSDHNGQNVTVQIYFNSITPTIPQGASASWLNSGMSFDTINQNFKLAYVDDETNPLDQNNWFYQSDIKFIKVNSAVLSTSNYDILNPGGYNLITLTLDPKFMLKGRTIHLLIAQGFKYSDPSIYFWDPLGLDKVIGNVNRFGYYGTLPAPF